MPWDPTLYRGTATWYARCRPAYPPQIFDELAKTLELDGTGTLFDLGCGTGRIALALADRFGQVIGADPDQEMLDEAARAATASNVSSVTWIRASDADLPLDLGALRVVSMGQSFHWMERERTARVLYDMVEPGGGLAVVGGRPGESGWADHSAPEAAATEVIRRWLGDERRAGAGTYEPPRRRHEDILAESPWGPPVLLTVPWTVEWTVDRYIGMLFSASYAAPHFFGDRVEAFQEEVKAAILAVEPAGAWTRGGECEAIVCRK